MATATYPDVREAEERTEEYRARVVPVKKIPSWIDKYDPIAERAEKISVLAKEFRRSQEKRRNWETWPKYAESVYGEYVTDLETDYSNKRVDLKIKAIDSWGQIYKGGTNSQRQSLVYQLDDEVNSVKNKLMNIENKLRNSFEMSEKEVKNLQGLRTQIDSYLKSSSNYRILLKEKIQSESVVGRVKSLGKRIGNYFFGKKKY